MLQDFEDFLATHSLKLTDTLGNLPHSCCSADTNQVIDFDKVKDEFCRRLGMTNIVLKSVDALYFNKQRDTLFLIEMKAFDAGGGLDCETFINQHFGDYGVHNKIVDSLHMIFGILGYHAAPQPLYGYFLDPSKLKVRTILLVNLTPVDMLSISLATLDKQKITLSRRIEGETIITNCGNIGRILAA